MQKLSGINEQFQTLRQYDLWDKEIVFVAQRGEKVIYVQSTYLLAEEETIKREYTPLEGISDNYEKYVVSMDDLRLPSRNGIEHVRTWEFHERIK